MPAKASCPRCGQKMRGPSHLCDPVKVARETRRVASLERLTAK